MKKQYELEPVFVEYITPDLEEGKLYITKTYQTASHLCACGCGEKVVMPFYIWGLTIHEDNSVTFEGSIGNYRYPCESHYLIERNKIRWL